MNRAALNIVLTVVSRAAVLTCSTILCFLLGVIVYQGCQAISPQFLLSPAKNFGSAGGILFQMLGSILLVVFAGFISLPLALGVAIYKSEYLNNRLLHKISDSFIYGLNAVPSIIFGIFGLIFFVNILNTGISWLVGSMILAIMILPTIVLSTYQALNTIPTIYRETAEALGLDQWQIITRVLLPQGISGAITGMLLGLARAIGETAPIMFIATAYSGVNFPRSFSEPVTTLPTHILALAKQATDQQALQNAWGASLVLMGLVTLLSLAALAGRIKLQPRVQR